MLEEIANELKAKKKKGDESEEEEEEEEEDDGAGRGGEEGDGELDKEVIRLYEQSRLKYFYAVVGTCLHAFFF
tara:strand:- start:386 stop:604 length:219 start_codon:yes stop_codon:yes gene_type:complete